MSDRSIPGAPDTTQSACCGPRRPQSQATVPDRQSRDLPVLDGDLDHDLVSLPGGSFSMGTADAEGFVEDREGPVRTVYVEPFAIGRFAVTNDQYGRFVRATGYVSEAERFGWSFVFARFVPGPLRATSPRPDGAPWWCGVSGAYWSAPEGPGSDVGGRPSHPAVHVSWDDANAYTLWAGGRLPTEPEWEYAARGGLDRARYPWGDELHPDGRHMCNIWQGSFPTHNSVEDGYAGTAPVDAFEPNGFGLYNVSGNVWEWCADSWDESDPAEKVMRGGSYLCHHSYCNRYRVAARSHSSSDSGGGNNGFRLVREPVH